MRPFSGKHRGLSLSLRFPLFWAAAVLGLVAALLGQRAPKLPADSSPRQPARARYAGINCKWLEGFPGDTPYLFDTETGGCAPCPVADAQIVSQFSCSPWRVGEGRHHVVACAMAAPRLLRWQADPPGPGVIMYRRPCWPSVPACGGRVLVSLVYREDLSRPRLIARLWWLQLSMDGSAIVAAERTIAVAGHGPSPPWHEETLPTVGVARDGTPLPAFLAQREGAGGCDLWVTPIAPAAAGRGPQALVSAGRKLAEGCAPGFLAFSADGRWLYASRPVGNRFRLERFAVAGPAAPRLTLAESPRLDLQKRRP